jgi:hypothetical protein
VWVRVQDFPHPDGQALGLTMSMGPSASGVASEVSSTGLGVDSDSKVSCSYVNSEDDMGDGLSKSEAIGC